MDKEQIIVNILSDHTEAAFHWCRLYQLTSKKVDEKIQTGELCENLEKERDTYKQRWENALQAYNNVLKEIE